MITNNETTGRVSICTACGHHIEEALLLKGLMIRRVMDGKPTRVPSPGVPTWRRLDRGPGSAKCNVTQDGQHVPAPDVSGSAFKP